jgi:hypothetical protein
VIVTSVPPAVDPDAGETDVMIGAAAGGVGGVGDFSLHAAMDPTSSATVAIVVARLVWLLVSMRIRRVDEQPFRLCGFRAGTKNRAILGTVEIRPPVSNIESLFPPISGDEMRPSPTVAWGFVLACVLSAVPLAQTVGTPQTPPRPAPPRAPTTTGLPSAPMPIQKQALDYFAGQWTFTWTGSETPLGPGPRTGTLTFTPRDGGKSLDGATEATSEDGPYRDTSIVQFDEDKKTVTWSEKRPNGIQFVALGDWSSPLAIQFAVVPITIKGQTYRLKRAIKVISAGSFSVTEEFAVGDGPFKRLGNGVFTRMN